MRLSSPLALLTLATTVGIAAPTSTTAAPRKKATAREGGPRLPRDHHRAAAAAAHRGQPGRLDRGHRRHGRAHGARAPPPRRPWPALSGSKLVIEKTRALLKQEATLDRSPSGSSRSCCSRAADSPATIPDVVAQRIEAEARQSAVLDGYTFCLQPGRGGALRPAGLGQRHRRHPAQVAQPRRARAGLDGQSRRLAASSSPASSSCRACATRWRARWATRRSSPCRSPTTA